MVSGGSCVLHLLNNAHKTQMVTNKIQKSSNHPCAELTTKVDKKSRLSRGLNGLLGKSIPGCSLGSGGAALNLTMYLGKFTMGFPKSKMQISPMLKSDFVLLLPDLSYFLALFENS